MSRYPPLAKRTRPFFRIMRGVGVLVLAAGLGAAFLLVDMGSLRQGSLVGVAAVSFAATTWLNPYSVEMRIAAAMTAVAMVLASGSLWFAVTVALLFVALMLVRHLAQVRVDPESLRIVAPDVVMPGAEAFVGEFAGLGWTQVGAVEFDVFRRPVIVSILLSPDRTQYARVTDVVMTVTSQIDDVRDVVTHNSGIGELPSVTLANDVTGGSPLELAAAHEVALEVIAPFGAEPVPQIAESLTQRVLDDEAASIEAVNETRVPLAVRGSGCGRIDGTPESLERVRSWLDLPRDTSTSLGDVASAPGP